MKALTAAERRMVRRLRADPYYRPTRARTKARFDGLVRAGVIEVRRGRALLTNPSAAGFGRIIVVRDEGEPDALYVGYTTSEDPKKPIGALARGNVRPLSLVTSWRADRREYERTVSGLSKARVRGCWYRSDAVRALGKPGL